MKRKVQKIHVVMGQTGEYSDHSTWPVAAYRSRKEAERHEIRATMRAKLAKQKGLGGYSNEAERKKFMGDLDASPGMQMDYTGTDYFTLSVPIRRTAPKEQL